MLKWRIDRSKFSLKGFYSSNVKATASLVQWPYLSVILSSISVSFNVKKRGQPDGEMSWSITLAQLKVVWQRHERGS